MFCARTDIARYYQAASYTVIYRFRILHDCITLQAAVEGLGARVYGARVRRCVAHRMPQRRWRTAALLVMATVYLAGARKAPEAVGGGSGEVMDLLSSVRGTYTHFVDDDLSVTVSYDLQDDSRVPLSFVTG